LVRVALVARLECGKDNPHTHHFFYKAVAGLSFQRFPCSFRGGSRGLDHLEPRNLGTLGMIDPRWYRPFPFPGCLCAVEWGHVARLAAALCSTTAAVGPPLVGVEILPVVDWFLRLLASSPTVLGCFHSVLSNYLRPCVLCLLTNLIQLILHRWFRVLRDRLM
jgi:hypothetical protein